jgi:hypothetical protein
MSPDVPEIEKSDSHWADRAAKDDAWFTVHVFGALIVRLVGAGRKSRAPTEF